MYIVGADFLVSLSLSASIELTRPRSAAAEWVSCLAGRVYKYIIYTLGISVNVAVVEKKKTVLKIYKWV